MSRKMARETGQSQDIGGGNGDNALLETLVNGYGNEYSDISGTIENVDAALDALESQSDDLFDEVKLMLEELRKDKAENLLAENAKVKQSKETDLTHQTLKSDLDDLTLSDQTTNPSPTAADRNTAEHETTTKADDKS